MRGFRFLSIILLFFSCHTPASDITKIDFLILRSGLLAQGFAVAKVFIINQTHNGQARWVTRLVGSDLNIEYTNIYVDQNDLEILF